ncbi:sialate O-acetylesterase [Halosquirtibacter xylanolyticus]|uniref:sialate O-acetylesterase n=1 Tax=Halosquirtibacter xylanolyticus TaxID=3374599 RepID=UPI003749A815|nr:sialate O-acetylesterase [Prolixibacteraceae bacterium]
MAKCFAYFIGFLLIPFSSIGKVWVPSIFSSGMILQRNENVKIWGKSSPRSLIVLRPSWTNETHTYSDDQGCWNIRVKTDNSRDVKHLSICDDSSKIEINNILFGEVWLCSGQSNMAWEIVHKFKSGHKVSCNDATKMTSSSKKHLISYFTVPKRSENKPIQGIDGEWIKATPKTTENCSAVAYSFAEKLSEQLNVPIGIVISAVGGSKIEAWLNKENNNKIGFNPKIRTNSVHYNSMIYPIKGYGIKGVIYYQGESNRHRPERYEVSFPMLIHQWRSDWNKELPFFYAQIAPYHYKDGHSYMIRDIQRRVAEKVSNTGVAILMDLGDENNVHPKTKRPVGHRLANIALHETYGKRLNVMSPIIKKVKAKGGKVEITFNKNIILKRSNEFMISGDNEHFYNANVYQKEDNKLIIDCENVKIPSIIRYAFKNWCIAELYGTDGLPVSSFEIKL